MSDVPDPVAKDPSTKESIVRILQAHGRATVGDLAEKCAVSDAAMRQHLDQLEADGLVTRTSGEATNSRGRPPTHWALATSATERLHAHFPRAFPDRHADLTAELLESIRESLGEGALATVIEHRAQRQIDAYRRAVNASETSPLATTTTTTTTTRTMSRGKSSLRRVVEVLADERDAEGYRAEAVDNGDGSFTLIEHHCAIDAAAGSCGALCEAELKIFRRVLDKETDHKVDIRRVEHLMAGGTCCRYEIRPR